MATLKEHQAAMVDLLANGSGIPASASRLAHAMHDVLSWMILEPTYERQAELKQMQEFFSRTDATTPGLNDKALSDCVEACRPKATPPERRVKELENTIKQLKSLSAQQRDKLRNRKKLIDNLQGDNAKLRAEIKWLKAEKLADDPEQAGCRKPDTQVCEHDWQEIDRPGGLDFYCRCRKCGREEE